MRKQAIKITETCHKIFFFFNFLIHKSEDSRQATSQTDVFSLLLNSSENSYYFFQ